MTTTVGLHRSTATKPRISRKDLRVYDSYPATYLSSEIRKLLACLGSNVVEPVAYDTAWVARIGHQDPILAAKAISWLRSHQLEDGSWGAAEPLYHHDRVISTLAAITALARSGEAQDIPRIFAAVPALQRSLASLEQDIAGRTIGFEMLLPTLMAEAQTLGVHVGDVNGVVAAMSRARAAKIAHAPKGLIDRYTTLGFSCETVGADGIHLLDTDNLQQEDGSVSVSPAATAFFVTHVCAEPKALSYLNRIAQHGGAPAVTTIDTFEIAWAMWNFAHAEFFDGTALNLLRPLLSRLQSVWCDEWGIAHASCFSVPDGDDTGLVCELLAKYHQIPDLGPIWYYEEPDHFRCFDLENHNSVSTNIHILGALRQAGLHSTDPAVQKIVRFLKSEQIDKIYWVDKWHASPFYPTSHAVIASAGYMDSLVAGAVNWLAEMQREDGSWGYYSPTAEETAYALQALLTARRHGHPVSQQTLRQGATWLAEHVTPPYPPLWIGKSLYCPVLVVRSAVLAALWQYESHFGSALQCEAAS